ncbi:MAG: type II secretion system protein GspD [Rhodospirillaceae bacterium]|nr:type II secretion system protein GspD [Rhodospirillaceae bacterium]
MIARCTTRFRSLAIGLLLVAATTVAGCDRPGNRLPPLELPAGTARPAPEPTTTQVEEAQRLRVLPARVIPSRGPTPSTAAAGALSGAPVEVSIDGVPLPSFINAIFGQTLRTNFTVDPKVAARTELVTLRTGGRRPPQEILDLTRQVLATYGVQVVEQENSFQILPSDALMAQTPRIVRQRALAEVPPSLRPVFHYVDIRNVRMQELRGWLVEAYGNKLRIIQVNESNAMLIFGLPEDIAPALEAIRTLDQPRFAGRRGLRLEPVYWSAERLTVKLSEILRTEGYNVSTNVQVVAAIMMLPIESLNSILVFATDEALLGHVSSWASDLDQPARADPLRRLFYYQVRNTNAEAIAAVMSQVIDGVLSTSALQGGGSAQPGQTATPAPAPPAVSAGTGTIAAPLPTQRTPTTGGRRLVVDPARNALIFQGSAEEYAQLRGLIESMDQPTRAALIEVTVAEVTLDDTNNLGVEWLLKTSAGGKNIDIGTLGGLGVGSSGLTMTVFESATDVRAIVNALSSNNRAQILSRPRVLARTGAEARIQVGSEVPIITSQTTSPTQTGGTTGVLQQIQYRNTGVILNVKPVVHGSRRVDLEITQEVSEATTNRTSDISSPVISNRRVNTQVALTDGATVMIGGLFSTTQSDGTSGVPFLKDIPGVGQLFRVDSVTNKRTELIVLITPYVVNDDADADAITGSFRRQFPGN